MKGHYLDADGYRPLKPVKHKLLWYNIKRKIKKLIRRK